MKIQILKNDEFPQQLREIPKPPKKLYIKGSLPSTDARILCIVGSRRNSDYGKKVVWDLVSGLKGYDVCIVSGLAIGIDSIVHEVALHYGIQTIAFPGSGLNTEVIYPKCNVGLSERILDSGGALVSEYEPNQKALPWMFPNRNRLMAGISHAVIVIEAEKLSGSLITSRLGLDYNREVGAVPGNITSSLSDGPNDLIRNGAVPITCSSDVLEMLGFTVERNGGNVSKDFNQT